MATEDGSAGSQPCKQKSEKAAMDHTESSNTGMHHSSTSDQLAPLGDLERSSPDVTGDGERGRSEASLSPFQGSEQVDCDHHNAPGSEAVGAQSGSKETVQFKVIYNKQKHDVTFLWDDTVSSLKQHISALTGVPPAMQKLMFKGLAKDEQTLRDVGITRGAKVMVVGSTLNDVLAANAPDQEDTKEDKPTASAKETFSTAKIHKKVLDKGLPEDVLPGIKNIKESLPPFPLSGMVNKSGGKVRLTFKLEVDQLWIGTKERTDKIPMNSIKNIVSEPIEGHEEYHIMGIQMGPTEASRYWIYWVPAQYVDAIKDTILGKWQYF